MRTLLYLLARLFGDASAVKKGKAGKRIGRRISGRIAGKALNKLWK